MGHYIPIIYNSIKLLRLPALVSLSTKWVEFGEEVLKENTIFFPGYFEKMKCTEHC